VNKSKKIYPIVNLAFKIIIAILSGGYLYYVLFIQKNEYVNLESGEKTTLDLPYLSDNIVSIVGSNPNSGWILFLILLLVFVNWGAEIVKWKMLVGKLLTVTYKLAAMSILGGIAASNMTPFKLGGFFARVAQLPFRHRVKSVAIIFLGDIAQLLSTLLLGSLSSLLLVLGNSSATSIFEIEADTLTGIATFALAATAAACIGFVFLDKFTKHLHHLPFLKNKKSTWDILNTISYRKTALKLLLISVVRLFTISIQYYLAFTLFGFELNLFKSILIINTLFLIYNFLPTFNIIEFGITKSAILVFLLKAFISADFVTFNVALVVSCGSFLIWVVNLAAPSAVGSFFLLRIKLFNHK
jgi:uncharacterized membrane protein YbhN (UPF0104 family)